ncbi:MAG: DoxX family protein [Hyphomonadaceae bacterium]|nr:DoxX family protein [Hyphomonadaceae bacterium]
MTSEAAPGGAMLKRAGTLYVAGAGFADAWLRPIALLGARLLVARVFFLSGMTKWNGLTIRDDASYLFADEYFAKYALPSGLTNTFTVMAAIGEIALPVLLALGLFSRFAAAGLLVMTAVIQIFVYPQEWWTVHAWWMAVLAVLVTVGPGGWSLDRALKLER